MRPLRIFHAITMIRIATMILATSFIGSEPPPLPGGERVG
jgi:hypothetical protein